MQCLPLLIAARTADDGEDEEEEVDNVEIEVEGSEDVFLRGDGVLVFPSDHHLSVEHNVLQQTVGKHSITTHPVLISAMIKQSSC